jgi:ABC-type glucose/galactose transport system permease subunit
MDLYLLLCTFSLTFIISFSINAVRVEHAMWKKCRQGRNRLAMQRKITAGKAHTR